MINRLVQELEQLDIKIQSFRNQRDNIRREEEYLRFKISIIEKSRYYQDWREYLKGRMEEEYLRLENTVIEREKIETLIIKHDMLYRILESALNESKALVKTSGE